MKMLDEIAHYGKGIVYERYFRIVKENKLYDKITKVKMIEEIYEEYKDIDNIISICTKKELEYLKLIINGKNRKKLKGSEYDWEIRTLREKFLIIYSDDVFIPEEIIDYVKKAIKKVNWKEKEKKDKLNILLIGYLKIYGLLDINYLISIGIILDNKENLAKHVINDKVFNFYAYSFMDYDKNGEVCAYSIFQDYFDLQEELLEFSRKLKAEEMVIFSYEYCEKIFYNDFDIDNCMIRNFLDELDKLLIYTKDMLFLVKECALLNANRVPLKESFRSIPRLKDVNLTRFFELLDIAMDKIPSLALNGKSPYEIKYERFLELKEKFLAKNKVKNVTQRNATLTEEDAMAFF